jgi:hypothetical protein
MNFEPLKTAATAAAAYAFLCVAANVVTAPVQVALTLAANFPVQEYDAKILGTSERLNMRTHADQIINVRTIHTDKSDFQVQPLFWRGVNAKDLFQQAKDNIGNDVRIQTAGWTIFANTTKLTPGS